jgi:rod shape-determining protein MreC
VITGALSSFSNTLFSYFDLQKVNQELLEQNSVLEMEVARLHKQINENATDTASFELVLSGDSDSASRSNSYQYMPARIVRNSVGYLHNYITINKGAKDGIRPDMGVVSPQGVAGIVSDVSEHYSIVISLLNVKSTLSCKIQHTNFSGALSWKGDDLQHAYLEQIATHAIFQAGDTIVTSGYSAIFPPGIMVGVVESFKRQDDDNFYSLKIRLFTDFQSLSGIYVIDNPLQKEQTELEREARKND